MKSGRDEFCEVCDSQKPLVRVYGNTGIKTSDGFKNAKRK